MIESWIPTAEFWASVITFFVFISCLWSSVVGIMSGTVVLVDWQQFRLRIAASRREKPLQFWAYLTFLVGATVALYCIWLLVLVVSVRL